MKNKNVNRPIKYFEQKDVVRPIALIALIVGLVLLWIGWGWIFSIILIPGAFITYIVSAAKTISHDEIPDMINKCMQNYDREFIESKAYKEVQKHPAPVETEAYEYGDKSKYFKKMKDSRVISDVYSKVHVFLTKDAVTVVGRRVSVTELDGLTKAGIEDIYESYRLTDIKKVTLEENELEVILSDTKKPQKVRQTAMVFYGNNGEMARFFVRNDMELVKFCEEIERKCS